MENLVIRDAQPADLEILLGFEQELIKAERPFDSTIATDPVSYYDIAAYIDDAQVKVLVAELNNVVVSSGYAMKKQARSYLNHAYYGYLGFMFTVPEYRGKGINGLVLDKLIGWCRLCGLNEIRLTVYEDNLPALKAYSKSGFKKHICEMRLTSDTHQ
ncbi:N-acetyltransferase GCN5 [Croceitalea dokdonensis DOKDO 023]|uniref:N-acetyltransferase GCN5 n=1 Tax=Croceitalea dokdonensis DOKDO 023 TaxID=1300341 RepID=A0A0P7AR66_9FLAO|nr:GNAT family N-acetyltransferase [Croceitalea dokdonensis]KPM30279.1 N-acetyltransferase GCN5 [Croceitalea dokdonensis DOKDO 023]